MFLFCVLWLYRLGSFLQFYSSIGTLCSHRSLCVVLFVMLLSTSFVVFAAMGIYMFLFTKNSPTLLLIKCDMWTLLLVVFSQHCLPIHLMCVLIALISRATNAGFNPCIHYRLSSMNICIWLTKHK